MNRKHLGRWGVLRIAAIVGALALSAASTRQQPASTGPHNTTQAPAPQAMDAQAAVGVWRTSFGPVKIELDSARPGSLMGVWVYQRNGREVIGYFGGPLRGNVLNFTWQEPTDGGAPLTGSGWLAFDVQGQRFSGRWWSTQGDRQGDWTGWRAEQGGQPDQPGYGGDAYGGHEYGGDAYGGHEYGGHEYGGQEPGGHDDGSQPPAHGGHNGGEAQPPSAPPGPPPPPRVHRNSI